MDEREIEFHGHDGFFKKAMSRKRVAKEFLETYLPEDIRKKIDLDSIEKQDSQFLSNILGKGISDMLFKVQFDGGEGYISVIIEHQSTPDYFMTFRIQQYILRLCEEYKRANKMKKGDKFPLVYPIIFYTGNKRYTAPKSFYELFADPKQAKQLLIEDTKVIDVNEIEDLREKYYSGMMIYLMKHIYEKEINPYFQAVLEILKIISIEDYKYLEDMIYYILEKGESERGEEILSSLKEIISEEKRGDLMTIAERFIAKGKQAGIEIGIQQGLEKGMERGREEGEKTKAIEIAKMLLSKKLDEQLISESTGLSLEEIRKLQKKYSQA